jgi:hypothetical protein
MKTFIKERAYLHTAVAFAVQLLISLFWKDLAELSFAEQIPVSAILWFFINLIFEWLQMAINKKKPTKFQILIDCVGASIGGVLGVIVYFLLF